MEGGILRNGNPATVETQRPARSLVKCPPSIIFRRLRGGRPHIFFAFSHGVGNACAVLAVARCLLGALATHYQLRDLSTAYCCMLGYDVCAATFSRHRVNSGRRRRPPTQRVYLQVKWRVNPSSRSSRSIPYPPVDRPASLWRGWQVDSDGCFFFKKKKNC